MCLSSTNIHFDYNRHYSKYGDDYEWIPTERICRNMRIYPFTKRLNLGYIPLVVEPKRQSYILDDEDVFVYLTSVDKEQRRNILHVEDIQELEIVQMTEQLSRVECNRNYGERESGYGEEENVGTDLEQKEQNEHAHQKH
uniref:MULE transposase N-terminal all-beta domain-containing protein n=2 Tax=Brassica oleracea TaxID=3712 RepID=A0A0D3BM26_BRAOL|nr:unnamed protein product [Brassica oleracea]